MGQSNALPTKCQHLIFRFAVHVNPRGLYLYSRWLFFCFFFVFFYNFIILLSRSKLVTIVFFKYSSALVREVQFGDNWSSTSMKKPNIYM
jgi:hypothetical protein